jgi:hypothetical protein
MGALHMFGVGVMWCFQGWGRHLTGMGEHGLALTWIGINRPVRVGLCC